MLCTPHYLLQLSAPRGAIPDLEPVAHPDDDDLAAEPCVLDQRGRQHHATLLVRRRLDGSGVVEALQHTGLVAERIEPREARLDQLLPIVRRVGLDAGIEPTGEHDAACQRLAEPRRQREAVLVIDRVVVFAEEHWSRCPRPTAPTAQPHSPHSPFRVRVSQFGSARRLPR
jgi:hypothetical protein